MIAIKHRPLRDFLPPFPVSSVQGQKNLANRAGIIATLTMMNEQIRKLDPAEAWHPDNIADAKDLDALRDSISETLVRLQREKAQKPTGGMQEPNRVYRSVDGLNALTAPVEHGDWFKLPDGNWQARQGYIGTGWTLVKDALGADDRTAHERIRDIRDQVTLIRAIIAAAQPVAAEAAKAGPKVHAKAIAAHVVESAVMAAGYNHKQDSFTAVANHANQIRRALTKAGLPAWAIDAAMDAAKKASDFRDGRARKVSSGPIVASLRQNGFILDEQAGIAALFNGVKP